MDLNSLKEAAANLTLYDLKAGVRKVQNGRSPNQPAVRMLTGKSPAVMNYTEMEAKVREATNNEPWVRTRHNSCSFRRTNARGGLWLFLYQLKKSSADFTGRGQARA